MKIKKSLIVTLMGLWLLAVGCSCDTWTSFWGGNVEKECADHWQWKEKEVVEPVKEVAKGPCEAPLMSKAMQSFPVGDERGNAVRLEKMAPTEVSANEPFDYRIKVTNLTNRDLRNVTVHDRVPENLIFKSSVPEMTKLESGEVQWKLGTLGPKASTMISANAVAEGEGAITSCAEVFYDALICAKINIVEPKLRLAKFAPPESLLCDRIPLRYVITNTGTGFACDIAIEETFDENLMTSEGKNKVMFDLASLGPGKSQEFKTMVDARKVGKYASKAIAKSRASGTVESNLTETAVSQPVLAISETGPVSQYIGRPLTYEIEVTNKGDGIAKNTTIEAMVPEEISFNSATMGGRFSSSSPGRVMWNIGNLEPNASKKVSMTLTGRDAASFTTMSTAKAYCAETVSATAQTALSGISGILLEVVDVADPIELGQSETYVITVTNQGSAAGTNIRISCILEENVQYVSSSGPTTASVVGNSITFAPLASLAPKAQTKWQVNVKGVGSGDTRFKAMLNSDQLLRPVEETEATTFYE